MQTFILRCFCIFAISNDLRITVASSALDALHEKELLHTLQTAYAGKTLLLISHRPSTLTGCDRILKITPPHK